MKLAHSIELLCDAFCVSRSGYHQWLVRQRTPSPRASQDAELAQEILDIDRQSRGTYGTPRIQAELKRRGRSHGKKRLDRIRSSLGLAARQKGRFRPRTTDSNHNHPIAANRLLEMAAPSGSDQVWVSDITYVRTVEGWLYVAAVMDLFSRRIVGWAFAHHLGTELVAAALAMALLHRRPGPGLVHHSDRGVQYASAAYRQLLARHGLLASMCRKANCYDNAAMEAFWSTLKLECIYRRDFHTRHSAAKAIFDFIEIFYNRSRLHSAIDYRSPVDFESSLN